MDKSDIVNIVTSHLKPLGFKRKGNNWVVNTTEIAKIVNLQKSQFSNMFYLSFGFIVKSIPLTTSMHIFRGVALRNAEFPDNLSILDLENNRLDIDREHSLSLALMKEVIPIVEKVNSEQDVLEYLQSLPNINTVPGVVKEYFKLA